MRKSCLLLAVLAFGQWNAAAQTATIDQVLKELESVRSFSGVAISPDGHWVAWVEMTPDHSGHSEIYLLERADPAAKPVRITDQPANEHSVVWSPDSKQFTFMRDQNQIFVVDAS